MKALVGAFNQEKALVGAFSVIVKTDCGTDGSFYSTMQEAFDPDCSRSIFTCSNKTGVDGEAVNVSQHLIISIGRHVSKVR